MNYDVIKVLNCSHTCGQIADHIKNEVEVTSITVVLWSWRQKMFMLRLLTLIFSMILWAGDNKLTVMGTFIPNFFLVSSSMD
jgi:hypothetical protein